MADLPERSFRGQAGPLQRVGPDGYCLTIREHAEAARAIERNIVYDRTGELLRYVWSVGPAGITLDHNLDWNTAGEPIFPAGSLESWRARSFDRHSIVADPLFVEQDRDDFGLKHDSPALNLGFRPLDFSAVGPRAPDAQRASK